MATVTATETFDPPTADGDARRVEELGYAQELKRGMGIFDSVAMGYAPSVAVCGGRIERLGCGHGGHRLSFGKTSGASLN